MDIQGSQYHLLYGRADWGGCTDPAYGETLAALWQEAGGPVTTLPTSWEYDDAGRVLRLRRDTPLFRRAGRTDPLDPGVRRGAGVDADGTTYWIDQDRRGIRRRRRARGAVGGLVVGGRPGSGVHLRPAGQGPAAS